jgi:hypothetical protein
MPKPKPSTITRDPYAFMTTPAKTDVATPLDPLPAQEKSLAETKVSNEKITTPLPIYLLERARNAAYWERVTLRSIILEGFIQALDRMERERGEAYPPRTNELQGGRPIGSRNAGNA